MILCGFERHSVKNIILITVKNAQNLLRLLGTCLKKVVAPLKDVFCVHVPIAGKYKTEKAVRRLCLLYKMAAETLIRSIEFIAKLTIISHKYSMSEAFYAPLHVRSGLKQTSKLTLFEYESYATTPPICNQISLLS